MRILLLAPNFTKLSGFMPSLGLAYLKSYICKHTCHEVEILDEIKINPFDIKNKICTFKPDIIGITCLTIYRYDAIKAAELAKKYAPDCKIVLGGSHPSFMYEQILNEYPFVDAVVIGEGEVTFKELVSAIESGTPLEDVKGIAFRNNGRVCVTEKRQMIQNLDELPFPAPMRNPQYFHDSIPTNEIGMIMSSRGCNYGCNFCSSTRLWGRWRARSPYSIFKEMKMLVEEQKKRCILFLDDEFTLDMNRIKNLCQILIDNKWNIPWACNTRVDHVSLEMLQKMKEAGCAHIGFGVESGSKQILENINKKTTVSQIKSAFAAARKAGLKTKAFFMIGNVGENADTIEQTKQLLSDITPDQIAVSRSVVIFPGSPLYYKIKKEGLLDDSTWINGKEHCVYDHENSAEQMRSWQFAILKAFYIKKGFLAFARFIIRTLRVFSFKELLKYFDLFEYIKKQKHSTNRKNAVTLGKSNRC